MKRSLKSWLWRVPLDQEVDEELGFHIEMRTRELVEKGLDPRIAPEMVRCRHCERCASTRLRPFGVNRTFLILRIFDW